MREIKWGVIIFRAFGIYTLLTVVNSSGYVIYHILLTLSGAIQDPSDRLISLIYPVLLGILIILTIVFFNIKRMPFSTKNNAEEPPAILSFDSRFPMILSFLGLYFLLYSLPPIFSSLTVYLVKPWFTNDDISNICTGLTLFVFGTALLLKPGLFHAFIDHYRQKGELDLELVVLSFLGLYFFVQSIPLILTLADLPPKR